MAPDHPSPPAPPAIKPLWLLPALAALLAAITLPQAIARGIALGAGLLALYLALLPSLARPSLRNAANEHRRDQASVLADALPDALLVVRNAQLAHRNHAAGQLFGPTLGTDLPATLKPLLDSPADVAHSQRLDLQIHPHGQIQAMVTISPYDDDGQPSQLWLIHDISAAERTRRQLQASNHELQAMAQRLFSVQEDERRAISRDLHDDIGQAITAMKLAAHAAMDETDPQRRNEDLGLLLEMADQTVGRLRDLSTLLRPPQLDALGLEAALSWQVRTILRNRQIHYQVDVPPLSQRPAALCEQTCFRIAQESLTNIVRHAHAGSVQLTLSETADAWMELRISDDGDGFETDGPRGLGLAVMRERAHGVGGRLQIDTAPGAGTRITCHLPFHPAAASQPGHRTA